VFIPVANIINFLRP